MFGKRTEARNCLKRAFQIALPDQFLSSICGNYEYLEELLQREIQTADAAEHVFLTKVTELGKTVRNDMVRSGKRICFRKSLPS